jgi:hypothetical protein
MGIIHRDLKPENVLVDIPDGPPCSAADVAGEKEGPRARETLRARASSSRFDNPVGEGVDASSGTKRRYRLVISDLGQSQRFTSAASRRTGGTGTVRFTAPEMLEEINDDGTVAGGGYSMRRQFVNSEWTFAADVWSLGSIFYCLCFSAVPWEETEDLEDLADIIINHRGGVPRPAKHPTRSSDVLALLDMTLAHDAVTRASLSALMATPVMRQAVKQRRGDGAAAAERKAPPHATGIVGSCGLGAHASYPSPAGESRAAKVTRLPSERDLTAKASGAEGSGGGAGKDALTSNRGVQAMTPGDMDGCAPSLLPTSLVLKERGGGEHGARGKTGEVAARGRKSPGERESHPCKARPQEARLSLWRVSRTPLSVGLRSFISLCLWLARVAAYVLEVLEPAGDYPPPLAAQPNGPPQLPAPPQ